MPECKKSNDTIYLTDMIKRGGYTTIDMVLIIFNYSVAGLYGIHFSGMTTKILISPHPSFDLLKPLPVVYPVLNLEM